MKYVKTAVLLLVAVAALVISWFVSVALFAVIIAIVFLGSLGLTLGQDTWRQTHEAERQSPQAVATSGSPGPTSRSPERGRPRRAADARNRWRAEVLPPDATVTFSEERRAAGVDEVSRPWTIS